MSFAIPAMMMGADMGLRLYESKKAKEEAEKAQKERERATAWNNLMAAVHGNGPVALFQPKPLPSTGIGTSIMDSAKSALGLASAMQGMNATPSMDQLEAAYVSSLSPEKQEEYWKLKNSRGTSSGGMGGDVSEWVPVGM